MSRPAKNPGVETDELMDLLAIISESDDPRISLAALSGALVTMAQRFGMERADLLRRVGENWDTIRLLNLKTEGPTQ